MPTQGRTSRRSTEPNVRAAAYFIIENSMLCLACNVRTTVHGFALAAGYESLEPIDDSDDLEDAEEETASAWDVPGVAAVLSYVEYLPDPVALRIQDLSPHYRVDRDPDKHWYWMNHCQHCGKPMDEEEVHEPLEGPFGEQPYEGWDHFKLHEVREPFEAWAGQQCFEPGYLREPD